MRRNSIIYTVLLFAILILFHTSAEASIHSRAGYAPKILFQKNEHLQEKFPMNASTPETTDDFFLRRYRVSVKKTIIRSGPGKNYRSLGTLSKNRIIKVKSTSKGWGKFRYRNRWGYVSMKHLK